MLHVMTTQSPLIICKQRRRRETPGGWKPETEPMDLFHPEPETAPSVTMWSCESLATRLHVKTGIDHPQTQCIKQCIHAPGAKQTNKETNTDRQTERKKGALP